MSMSTHDPVERVADPAQTVPDGVAEDPRWRKALQDMLDKVADDEVPYVPSARRDAHRFVAVPDPAAPPLVVDATTQPEAAAPVVAGPAGEVADAAPPAWAAHVKKRRSPNGVVALFLGVLVGLAALVAVLVGAWFALG